MKTTWLPADKRRLTKRKSTDQGQTTPRKKASALPSNKKTSAVQQIKDKDFTSISDNHLHQPFLWCMNTLLSRRFIAICSKKRHWLALDRLISSDGLSSSFTMGETKNGLKSEYIDVNDVELHVLKCGSIRPPQSRKQECQYLFLIIPGNPGIPEYYEEFMHTLWQKSQEKIPVWCVSHAGHVTSPKHSPLGWIDIVRQPGPAYTLEGQISHKINFIKNHIPPDVTLILIGHSIGCYIIMNLLPEIPEFQVLRCFMLFPTIERMAETPNGKFFTPTLNYLRWVIIVMVKLLSYLGPKLQRKIIQYHFADCPIPECGIQASLNLFNPTCFNHATYMGKMEMKKVGELQEDLLTKYLHKMSFYYGSVDKWCPKEFCYNMQAKFPDADIRLCQMDFSHAFVLDAGEEMAHTLWDWVSHHLKNDCQSDAKIENGKIENGKIENGIENGKIENGVHF